MAHVTDRPTGGVVLLDENDAAAVEIDKSTKTVTIYGSPLVSGGGTPGPPGAPGAPGAAGADGAAGAQGRPGTDGQDGDDGAPGPPGAAGAAGAPGAQGPQGLNGSNGVDGQDGDDGFPGPPGTPGAAGASGAPGATGATGLAGPPGQDGEDAFDWPLPGPQGATATATLGTKLRKASPPSTQSIPGTAVLTQVVFTSIDVDDGSWGSLVDSSITVPTTAWYSIAFGTYWASAAATTFSICLYDITASTQILQEDWAPTGAAAFSQQCSLTAKLTAGHHYGLYVAQGSGVAINIQATGYTILAIAQIGGPGATGATGATGPTGPTAQITQVEVDFGTTPVEDATFTITDPLCTTQSKIIPHLAGDAPTGKDVDEITMDDLFMVATPGTGSFDLYIRGQEGYVADKFKINYLLTTPGF